MLVCYFSHLCSHLLAAATYRDHGPRANRAKTRLIWLIEELGFEPFTNLVAETMGPGTKLHPAVHVEYDTAWERRDLLGVHKQKQEGLNWVGASVPSGRITAEDLEVGCALAMILLWDWVRHQYTAVSVGNTACTAGSEVPDCRQPRRAAGEAAEGL